MAGELTTYRHTQRAPLCLVIYLTGVGFFFLAWVLRNEPSVPYLLTAAGTLMLVLGGSFHYLTVADEGDRLAIEFGPLPMFRRTVRYEEIQEVSVGRTTILDGWGIHMSLRGGWVWNIWGRDCVVLQLRKGKLRVGTDDAENLAAFVKTRIIGEDER